MERKHKIGLLAIGCTRTMYVRMYVCKCSEGRLARDKSTTKDSHCYSYSNREVHAAIFMYARRLEVTRVFEYVCVCVGGFCCGR